MNNKKRRYIPDLVSDMAECDANFYRLHRLFPGLFVESEPGNDIEEIAVRGITRDGVTISIQIKKRYAYTTILSVQIKSEMGRPWIKWPNLEVKVYTDLNSAEVVGFEQHRNYRSCYPTPNPHMYQPDEKSQINRFFGELLTFCIRYGHTLDRSFT